MLLRASPDSSTMPLTDSISVLGGCDRKGSSQASLFALLLSLAGIAGENYRQSEPSGVAETDVVCAIAIRNDGGILPLLAFGLRGIESDGETTA